MDVGVGIRSYIMEPLRRITARFGSKETIMKRTVYNQRQTHEVHSTQHNYMNERKRYLKTKKTQEIKREGTSIPNHPESSN